MLFENLEAELLLLYNKAKKSFDECIRNKDNVFLRDEVRIPLFDVKVVEQGIKIVFSKRDFKHYTFEVCLLLFDGSMEIGKYIYFENDRKEGIDDRLTFY